MKSPPNELSEWYLAFLRRKLQEKRSFKMLTPLSLIEADQELLKQVIEQESRKDSVESKPRAGAAFLSDSGRASLFAVSLLLCIAALLILLLEKQLLAALLVVLSIAGILLSRKEVKSDASALSAQAELSKQKDMLIFEACPQLLSQLSSDLKIICLNESCLDLLGAAQHELFGKDIADLIMPDSIDRFLESAKRSKDRLLAESVEIRVKHAAAAEPLDLLWRMEWSERAGSYFCIADDISGRKRKERLEHEMNELISHDLRAPVSALSMWIANMLLGTYGELSEHGKSVLKRSSGNLKSVISLLDNLLDGNKLDAGRMKSRPAKFPVQDLFEQADRLYLDWFETAQLKLEIESTDLSAFADSEQSLRIISNLLSNAAKWSPPGSRVKVRAKKREGFVSIEIEDSGSGIPDNLQCSLFQRWEAGEKSRRAGSPSIGLGLYIARLFTELQGGEIGVCNSQSGGTIFWFTLPEAKSD